MSNIRYEIKSFQEFTLNSCFYEAYLPTFTYFGGEDIYFFMNTLATFSYENGEFIFKEDFIEKRVDMENKFGIFSNMYEEPVDDIVNKIIHELNQGSIVLCRTLNAWAFNPDNNRRTEISNGIYHWILVFGYDLDTQVFDVLEHYTNVAALYYPLKMNFNVLEQAYKDSFENPDFKESLYIINKQHEIIRLSKEEYFVNLLKKRKASILESRSAIICYIESLSKEKCRKISQKDIIWLVAIIKYIRIINYIILMFQENNDIGIDVINHVNLLRTYCIKWMRNKIEKNWIGILKYCTIVQDDIEKLIDVFVDNLVEA